MDGFMETGDGLDAVFEAALLGGDEPENEPGAEPGNPQENEPGEEPGNPQEPEGNNPQEPEDDNPPGNPPQPDEAHPPEGNSTRAHPPQRACGEQPPEAALGEPQDAGELIRRGMAYDAQAGRGMALLNSFAAMAGMDLDGYLGCLEQARDEQELTAEMDKIRGRYPDGTPDEALRDIAKNAVASRRAQQEQARQEQARQAAEMQRQAAQSARDGGMRQEIESFRAAHPEIKSSADVPQEVWEAINASGGKLGLNAAYTAYERDQARAEAGKLREQLAAAQKMGANRRQSTGSMEGAGEDDMDAEFKRILLS